MADRLLTTEEVALILSMSTTTLRTWRARNRGPRYVKLPTGSVRYRKSDLDAFTRLHAAA